MKHYLGTIEKLKNIISSKDKHFFILMIPFSLFIALIEMIGISAVMPFIHVATDFEVIHKNIYYQWIYNFFNMKSEITFVLIFAAFLIGFYLFRALINQLYIYSLTRFSQRCARDISFKLFKNYIGFSYRNFIERSSGRLIKAVLDEASNIAEILTAYIQVLTESIIIVAIYSFLLFISWKITLILTLFLGINAFIIKRVISSRIRESGKRRESSQGKFYEILHMTFSNFKMIKLRSNEDELLESFNDISNVFMRAKTRRRTLMQTPKIYLEAIGFIILILLVAYWVEVLQSDISTKIGTMSVFILALYRLLPSVSKTIYNYNQIAYLEKSLEIVHTDLSYDIEKYGQNSIVFNEKITLKNISFTYIKHKYILNNISLEIHKGDKVAFIGESGSGKSTLADIIIGLYQPTEGSILIDGVQIDENNLRSWRRKIGYIPQSIYLFDGSVAENIALEKNYNYEKIVTVLKQAKIFDFLQENHEGVQTQVGEHGVKLSGGQKQRIAIARALYHDPELLVLDEATSALDTKTEAEIMKEVYDIVADKTLIIIAHRLSTIKGCDYIYNISDTNLSKVNTIK